MSRPTLEFNNTKRKYVSNGFDCPVGTVKNHALFHSAFIAICINLLLDFFFPPFFLCQLSSFERLLLLGFLFIFFFQFITVLGNDDD